MGICLSTVMLLMGAGTAQDVENCGKIRILGFYMQDKTRSFIDVIGPGKPYETEVSKFFDKAVSTYPDSLFGVYAFTDRLYNIESMGHTIAQPHDIDVLTPLTDATTAKPQIKRVIEGWDTFNFAGTNSGAFDLMYHLIVNDSDSGIDSITPLPDTYDAKVFYVFTDGIPEYLEATEEENTFPGVFGTNPWCQNKTTKCCEYDNSTDTNTPKTSLVDYRPPWNSVAECPIDLETLGKKINENDWYVVYVNAGQETSNNFDEDGPRHYNWSAQVKRMGIESRFSYFPVDRNYTDLSDILVNATSEVMCSVTPSNNASAIPTGGPTNAPTTGGATAAPTAGGSTAAPTTGGPTLSTQSGQGGTTTTTTICSRPRPAGYKYGKLEI